MAPGRRLCCSTQRNAAKWDKPGELRWPLLTLWAGSLLESAAPLNAILIADDEAANRDLLTVLLEPLGVPLVCAVDGEEVLGHLARGRFDLVLLDVMMPGKDGLQVLRRVREDPALADLPVVLVTAAGDREHRMRGFEAGATEFLTKPVDRALLLTRVRTLLRYREASEAVKERNAELEQLHQEQRVLTDFVVHDLKNPLSVILSNLTWLRQELPDADPETASALADSHRSASRMLAMIGDLLLISKMEKKGSGFVMRRAPVDLSAMVEELCRERAALAAERELALTFEAPPELTAALDGPLIHRVLENLLENALRYADAGGQVRLSAARQGAELLLAVANTGRPIPPEERARLFARFSQGSNALAPSTSVGLGLYFCRLVAEAHGGSIAVDGVPGWPTRFVVRLPVAEPLA